MIILPQLNMWARPNLAATPAMNLTFHKHSHLTSIANSSPLLCKLSQIKVSLSSSHPPQTSQSQTLSCSAATLHCRLKKAGAMQGHVSFLSPAPFFLSSKNCHFQWATIRHRAMQCVIPRPARILSKLHREFISVPLNAGVANFSFVAYLQVSKRHHCSSGSWFC